MEDNMEIPEKLEKTTVMQSKNSNSGTSLKKVKMSLKRYLHPYVQRHYFL